VSEAAYAVQADLVSKIDADVVAELQKATGDIDVALLDASRELDGRLCSRYAIPITGPQSLSIIRGKCVAIAKYFFLGRKLSVGHQLTADARGDYLVALDWAAGVAKKTYSLPDAPLVVAPSPDVVLSRPTGVMVGGDVAIFNTDAMFRF
jgi:phage gp36-like protein